MFNIKNIHNSILLKFINPHSLSESVKHVIVDILAGIS
uniref:Uncharacterized protein n=1 Tax=Geladintestivirus 2 TaxID=3233134 RepID=A0AAU8MIP3_9CAUD